MVGSMVVSGEFNLEISLPQPVSPGQHNLTVTINPEDRYSGASVSRNITVALMPLAIDMDTPSYIFLPNLIRFEGSVKSEMGPVADAGINLTFNDTSAAVRTAHDGSFSAILEIPFDMSFIGQREMTVGIYPSEPWVSNLTVNRSILVINPVGIGLVLLAALALIVLALRKHRIKDTEHPPIDEVIRSPVLTTPRVPAIKLTGIRGRIISAYRAGLIIVARISGIRMAPHVTLREFLKTVTQALPGVTRPFAGLTTLAENALYSDRRPPKETAATAEGFSADINKELGRGTS